ncbi:MAG: tetratricopeptide repeat protein [Alphaproteobacteria bacterium]|nr:MAG: tetratricopeptide repeat protein [Alphaproteobacteria bacterium]
MAQYTVKEALAKAAALAEAGQTAQAKSLYGAILKAFPDNAAARQGLGTLSDGTNTPPATAEPPKPLLQKVLALYTSGQYDAASTQLADMLKDYPDAIVLWNLEGATAAALKDWGRAEAAFRKAVALNPASAVAHNNLGNILKETGRKDAAAASYERAIELKPDYIDPRLSLAAQQQEKGQLADAVAHYQAVLALKPDHAEVRKMMLHQQQYMCDWRALDDIKAACPTLGIEGEAIAPFGALAMEDAPERQLLRSRNWARSSYKQQPLPLPARPKARPDRLRIGYFSADFHDHATLYLMAGLFRHHDKRRFDIRAYSYGSIEAGAMRTQLQETVDQFTDIRALGGKEVAGLARAHGLDIAIDLKGYTAGSRSQLFAYRLAPLQISMVGYCSTMGADFIDYMVTDPLVVPEGERAHYSESMLWMPDFYLPTDDRRRIAETATTRADFGLPEDGFVFCSFNKPYKVSPREFDIWMRLLHRVEGSVLWQLKPNKWAQANMQKEAAARGIDPARLVFAPWAPSAEHLARHKHADLFLDTFVVNGHTTAVDALWTGLPLISRPGRQLAARVAASCLTALGLEDLVAQDDAAYEALAYALATDPGRLSDVRARIEANKHSHALFDSQRYTRHFEQGLDSAYARYLKGLPPTDIKVVALP